MMDAFRCKNCGRFFTARKEIAISKCPLCGSKDFSAVVPVAGDRIIDWEQRRYEIAKSAMQGILANSHESDYRCGYKGSVKFPPKGVAEWAVEYADNLIAELKKEKKEEKDNE